MPRLVLTDNCDLSTSQCPFFVILGSVDKKYEKREKDGSLA